jgi:hypothetical protein
LLLLPLALIVLNLVLVLILILVLVFVIFFEVIFQQHHISVVVSSCPIVILPTGGPSLGDNF